MDNKLYWIWLQLALGPATVMPNKLLNSFDFDVEKIYNAEREELLPLKPTPRQLNALLDKSTEEASRIIQWCEEKKVSILCQDDPRFPKKLRELPDCPTVLYYIGELYDIDRLLCIAGVGARVTTKYGRNAAYTFSYHLAKAGAVVVSGLAQGIDTVCHRAALDAGGKTIAVIGCRIDKVYPSKNRDIMREIARKGLLITEYHPFYKTSSLNFPQRNRLISGLSQGTIVFEADKCSGSLITAHHATRQGRDVFALPGRVGEKSSLGTNELIRDGAVMITEVDDIIERYRYLYDLQAPSKWIHHSQLMDSYKETLLEEKRKAKMKDAQPEKPIPENSDDELFDEPEPENPIKITDELQLRLYSKLEKNKAIPFEKIIEPGDDLGKVLAALTVLELSDYIVSRPGNTFIKK